MSYTEIITCRVAVQVCVGYLPNGRERHRTFSMKGINPDAPDEAIAAVVRALAPVLAYPITKVRKVVKRTIIFDEWTASPAAPALALALPVAPARMAVMDRMVEPAEPETPFWVYEAGEEEKIALMLLALACLRQRALLRQQGWGQLALLLLCAQAAQAWEFARAWDVPCRSPPPEKPIIVFLQEIHYNWVQSLN